MIKKMAIAILIGSLVARLQAASINSQAPDFVLNNSHGKPKTLNDFKGKILFINFWASWCAPCQIELPQLNQLAIDEGGKNVAVIAINVDQEAFKAGALLTKLGLQAPDMEVLLDPKSKAVAAYDAETMPSSFILDEKGIIRFAHTGFQNHDPEKWHHEIDGLLKGATSP